MHLRADLSRILWLRKPKRPILSSSRLGGFYGAAAGAEIGGNGANGSPSDNRQHGAFKNNVEIYFNGSTTLDNGLTAGVHIELEGNNTSGRTEDELFVYFKGGFGEFRFGDTGGALGKSCVVDPGAITNNFGLISPNNSFSNVGRNTPIGLGGMGTCEDHGNQTKAVYFSPVFGGFQGVVSYLAGHRSGPRWPVGRSGDGHQFDQYRRSQHFRSLDQLQQELRRRQRDGQRRGRISRSVASTTIRGKFRAASSSAGAGGRSVPRANTWATTALGWAAASSALKRWHIGTHWQERRRLVRDGRRGLCDRCLDGRPRRHLWQPRDHRPATTSTRRCRCRAPTSSARASGSKAKSRTSGTTRTMTAPSPVPTRTSQLRFGRPRHLHDLLARPEQSGVRCRKEDGSPSSFFFCAYISREQPSSRLIAIIELIALTRTMLRPTVGPGDFPFFA